jgi:hypothetical protein
MRTIQKPNNNFKSSTRDVSLTPTFTVILKLKGGGGRERESNEGREIPVTFRL